MVRSVSEHAQSIMSCLEGKQLIKNHQQHPNYSAGHLAAQL